MFVPLHIYSEYSFLKSGLKLEQLFSYIKKLSSVTTLGISDLNTMHGLPIFFFMAKKHGIKPVLGIDIPLDNMLLSIYISDNDSYLDLVKIANLKALNTLTFESLIKHIGKLNVVLSTNKENDLIDDIKLLQKTAKSFYFAVEIYSENDYLRAYEVREFAKLYNIPTIAFPHIKYLKTEDAIVLRILEAIDRDETMDYKTLLGPNYLPSNEQISSCYLAEEIENTKKIANDATFEFNKNQRHLLKYQENTNSHELLRTLAYEGLRSLKIEDKNYITRLEYELSVIEEMDYSDYFLIVSDYIKFANEQGIIVGPGRGSAAGSLVSLAIGITQVDPIKNQLIFERFLNPKRKSMPDIDIDFEDTRRDEIVEYLIKKYSNERVASIVTYQSIGAKQALRDIGRVFKYSTQEIDYLSKMLGAFTTSFKDAYRTNMTFKKLIDSEAHYLEIVSLANKIEGFIRQHGQHAAGIVLSDCKLEDALPIMVENGRNITQYEMYYLEDQGFLKMDLLSLRNLSIMKRCLALAKQPLNINLLPYDDLNAIKIIRDNLTCGLFQLESGGIKKAIEILRPASFEDIVALLALYRPGPMEMIPQYAKYKDKEILPVYENEVLERILKPTYGIIIYQEQIMQIAVDVAGFSLADADNFRRAISKKDINVLKAQEKAFIDGAINNGYNENHARKIFLQIEKFADYGFNKAHSVSYAIITCQMAYLKYKYPREFYASILESESSFTNTRFFDYIQEMRKAEIKICLPNINLSSITFIPAEKGLIFPLLAIKGLQKQIVESIILERETNGAYIGFFDFVKRNKNITENALLKLIDAGAFDEFNNRATLRASVKNALMQAKISDTLGNLLHYELVNKEKDPLYDLEREYDAIGMMLSGSLLGYKSHLIKKENVTALIDVKNTRTEVTLAGIIKKIKVIRTKNGEQMCYLTIIDESDELDVTVFPKVYETARSVLNINEIVLLKGTYRILPREGFVVHLVRLLEEKS